MRQDLKSAVHLVVVAVEAKVVTEMVNDAAAVIVAAAVLAAVVTVITVETVVTGNMAEAVDTINTIKGADLGVGKLG